MIKCSVTVGLEMFEKKMEFNFSVKTDRTSNKVMNYLFITLLTFSVFIKTMSVNLKVVGPAAPLVVDVGSDLVLPCSLQPTINAEDMRIEWFRMDIPERTVHVYKDYSDANDEQIQSYRGRTALFKEELQKGNTSLKLSAVQPSDEGAYKCLVESLTWYDDITVYVEVKGKVFHAWMTAVICISVFGVLFMGFASCIWKVKFSKKQLTAAQCSAVSYLYLKSANVRKEWNLKRYNTTEEGYRKLIPAIRNCRKAILADCNLTEESAESLAAVLQAKNSSLKHLDLHNNNLQDSGVEKLSDGLKSSNCKVEELRLSNCNLEEKACENLKLVLQSESCSLIELDLSNNDLKDSGVMLLSDGLQSSNCKLRKLWLVGCKLNKESWHPLKRALQTNKSTLKELDVSNNDLKGVDEIFDGQKMLHLEILRFKICNLDESSCKSLGSVLQSADCKLKELELCNNDLKDAGVALLSEGLKSSHCQLEILRLSGCSMTNDSCSSLALALKSNSHLKELDLTFNHVGDSGVKLLTAQLDNPHCKLRLGYTWSITPKMGLRKYVCELTVDPDTAHPRLSLSEDNRKVMWVGHRWSRDHPQKFNIWRQVMCKCSLRERSFWEAEWSGDVSVAVTYSSVKRKGSSNECKFGFNRNSWSLYCYYKSYTARHNKNKTFILAPTPSSNRVGVYLDKSAGTLSFYSISSDTLTLTHLHTFHSEFSEPLYAGFGFWSTNSKVRLCQI